MRVPGLAWGALAVGVVGLVMVFSLLPDPWPYIGAALMVLARSWQSRRSFAHAEP
jgi:hypothetical protein